MQWILLAIAAAFGWGATDYVAGVMSRRLSAVTVTGAMLGFGAVGAAAVLLLGAHDPLRGGTVVLALLAGALTVVGLSTLYQALATGRMSVVAPISATGVVIPVLADLIGGQQLGAAQLAGIVLAIGGMLAIVSLSAEEGGGHSLVGPLALALVAAVTLGLFYLVSGSVASGQVLWFVVVAQGFAATVLAVASLALRVRVPSRGEAARLALLGLLSLGGWLAATTALSGGQLSITSTITALFPVVTVLLAIFLQGERPRGLQVVALVAVFAGVAAIAAG